MSKQAEADENPSESRPRVPRPLVGTRDQVAAMRRALANAPLGPTATLALTSAILSFEAQAELETAPRTSTFERSQPRATDPSPAEAGSSGAQPGTGTPR